MAEDPQEQVDLLTYKKAYLHTLKYPNDDVIGVLIGKIDNGSKIKVTDAYPLFHTRVLTPTLETAFEIIDAYISARDEKIVGIYTAYIEQSKGEEVTDLEVRILSKIQEAIHLDPFILKILSKELDGEEENQRVSVLVSELYRVHWKSNDEEQFNKLQNFQQGAQKFQAIAQNIERGEHRRIIDFDSHFEDPALDFTNSFVQ